jgi:hypothetical protein
VNAFVTIKVSFGFSLLSSLNAFSKYFGLLEDLYFFEFNLTSSTISKYFSPAFFLLPGLAHLPIC